MGKSWEKETLFFPRGWSTKPYGLELQNVMTERGWMGFMSGAPLEVKTAKTSLKIQFVSTGYRLLT
jgi:hypothetical protein